MAVAWSVSTCYCCLRKLGSSVLLCPSETWTLLATDVKAVKSFHIKCQQRISGITWRNYVQNTKPSSCTGLPPVSDRITRRRNAIFGQVARLSNNTYAHEALPRQVELLVGRHPDPTWKLQRGRPHAKWLNRLQRDNNNIPIVEASHRSRSLGSDATVHVDHALTTMTTEDGVESSSWWAPGKSCAEIRNIRQFVINGRWVQCVSDWLVYCPAAFLIHSIVRIGHCSSTISWL